MRTESISPDNVQNLDGDWLVESSAERIDKNLTWGSRGLLAEIYHIGKAL